MKIAITGHTSGIGKAFSNYLTDRGHDIVGLSKRDGNNIRNISKIVQNIEHCDMFINNAQSGFAQTELFLHVAEAWKESKNKMIWNISTILANSYTLPQVPGLNPTQMVEYRTQKRSLEDAIKSMSDICFCKIMTIRPGNVATEDYKTANIDSADTEEWDKAICDFYIECTSKNLYPKEISLGFKKGLPEL